jgi:hypothetical protein
MDQDHLLAAARYVDLNPVRAGIRRRLEEEDLAALRSHERTGRPLGEKNFLAETEAQLSRSLAK